MKRLVCLIILLAGFSKNAVFAQVDVKPGEIKPIAQTSVLIGEEFEVPIRINTLQDLFSVSFILDYDSVPFDVVNVRADSHLGSDAIFFSNSDESKGDVSIAISRTNGQGGINGPGTLAVVRFKAVGNLSAVRIRHIYCSTENARAQRHAKDVAFTIRSPFPRREEYTTKSLKPNKKWRIKIFYVLSRSTSSLVATPKKHRNS